MALFSFSKFKPCNSAVVHQAVVKALEAGNGSCIGAAYAFYDKVLVIAFTRSVKNRDDRIGYQNAVEKARKELSGVYDGVEFWDDKRFSEECPEKVKKVSGYVSAFHPERGTI